MVKPGTLSEPKKALLAPLAAAWASNTWMPLSKATSRNWPLCVTNALVAAWPLLLPVIGYPNPADAGVPSEPTLNTRTLVSVTTKRALPSALAAIPNGLPVVLGTETSCAFGSCLPRATFVLHFGGCRTTSGGPPPLWPLPPVPLVPLVPLPPPLVSAYAAAPPPRRMAIAATSASGDFHHGRVRLACASGPPYWP